MRSIIRGIVALVAAFLMMDAAYAAPTIVSPADYSTVSTMTEKFKGYLDASGFTSSFETSDYYKNEELNPDSVRVAKRLEFFENSAPVTVKWSGSVGTSTVKIWRTNKDTSSTPVFTKTTTGNSATFYDLEIGRNYTWTVADSTGTATGHFYTSRYAPRMIKQVNETAGSACSNGRDIGGRMTEDGTKAIKQGLIYRTAQLEYCNPRNATTGVFEEMSWLKNTLGIKLDIDLRLKSHLEENYVGANHKKWTEEEAITDDTNDDIPDSWVGKYKYRYIWKNSSYLDIDESNIGDGVVRYCVNTTTGIEFPSWSAFFSSDANRKAVWIAFNAIYESVKKGEPVIFHCSHGKDRGGTLAFVIHGVLGVTKNEAIKDFLISWFDAPDETVTLSSINTQIVNKLKTYDSDGTFKQQCEAYLVKCGINYGLTEATAKSKIEDFQSLMLEEPETAAEAPLDDIGTAEEGDWGYRKTIGNEVAIVFTNHTKTVTWTVPEKLENVKFLVVGGGGGGGADFNTSSNQSPFQGGAGGGGGGVVEGLINFGEGDVVSISVGAGGNGGHTSVDTVNGAIGAGVSGAPSSIKVGAVDYVIAYGGGGDGGSDGSNDMAGNVGKSGGSSAGSRPGQSAIGDLQPAFIHESLKSTSTPYGNKGGAGATTYWYSPWYAAAGGGGGATQAGFPAASDYVGGAGGEGLTSSITGEEKVYGSGGGGGSISRAVGGKGGTGAGDGNPLGTDGTAGLSALANQGGGGGGGGRMGAGGAGGSGIVVLRYVDPDYSDPYVVAVPKAVTGLVYDGTVKTGVEGGTGYTLTANTATDAGSYIATATLAEGYTWSDGSTATQKITWSIAKATNVWTTEPNITPASWIVGNTAGKLTSGVAKFGTVTATMNGAAFTEFPTAVGTYSIVCTVEGTSNYTALSATITFEITEVPVINPTEYGTVDKAASTYTWLGYTGPWMYTTNWTATASGTYGVPNNGTYATADFPAALANAFTCTLNQNVSVKYAKFDAPNMTLVIDNAALTVNDRANPDEYLAYGFGTGENADATLEFRGASAGIVSSKSEGRCMFGLEKSATDKLRCTIRFIVPASGWESTAPIRATGRDCSVYFWYDAKLVIDATALGVPAENEVKTALLATATDGMYNLAKVEITCADGAKGSVAVDGAKLVLTVEADETTEPEEPQEPQLTAVDAPVAQAGLVYTGKELTGVEGGEGYTLTDNTATDAGTYEATATLAEGYKWSDGSTDEKKISWSIGKAENAWTTEPSISLETWTQGEAAGVLTSGAAKFGTVTASMTELPTEVGSYTITYTVAETKNYTGLNATVQFEIKAPEVVEPEEPGDDPVSQIPTIPAEWGYVKTDLGDLHNEVAVVFTNHIDKAMSWTVPADIENVQFLVVGGGGGGGGAVNSTKGGAGGAGGGGGCVVTGIVNKLVKDAVVSVQVGNGGNGGTYNSSATAGNGKASHGESSLFKVGNVTYVTAFGGAGDLGYNKNSGVNNGSNSGSRYNGTTASAAVGTAATWDQTALSDKLSNVATLRNKGGNNANNKTYSSGGGGGAIEAGQAPGSSSYGGYGGKGLTSSITDVEKMYGSGGSGATAKNGGYEIISPDGAGSSYPAANGTDGAVNQGGGGGGGGYQSNGGKGGSGIVVFRYTLKSEVKVDAAEYIESKLTDKVYTGSLLMSGLTDDAAYTVSEEGGVNVGEYTVTVTLKSGFVWADGNTSSTSNFTWKITKNANEWATEPLLSVTSWAQGYAPNVKFVAPVQTIGELNATITTNGVTEAFSGTLPIDPGEYTINYSVVETDNYAGRTWSASFKIYRSEPIEGGYKVFGLGENGNEEAMVFTQSGSWNIDKTLKNVQFLVVGGGGGGGADISTSNEIQAGSGGGGGGVVTGRVNFAAGQTVAITVGAGGQGGVLGDGVSPYGAVKTQAENSSFAIGTETSVVAYAGGGDTGSTVSGGNNNANTTGGQTGGNGGSSAGSRATATGRGEATCGSVNDTANVIICSNTLGNKGGAGAAQYQAGGGGGATTEGEDGTENAGGNGGEGLASSIIGTDLVYGSGGGGGAVASIADGPGLGGSGAGNGGHTENATSAMPNQGGGGGGGGRVGNGGNGGSGIVVFRYVVAPQSPSVDGKDYDADKVFDADAAKVSKPITYPGNPEVTTNTVDGVVTITFGGVPAQVPAYYNVTKVADGSGYQIVLAIKDEFKNPVIANSENEDGSITPAIKVEGDKVTIHLEGAQFSDKLYYIFKRGGDLTDRGAWEVCNMTTETGDVQFDLNADDTAGFFEFIKVSDEEMTE